MPNCHTNLPLVLFVALMFCLSQLNLARILGPLEPNIFALQLAFTPEQFWAVVRAWGSEGVARFQSHFAYDFVHPLVYGALGYLLVHRAGLFIGRAPWSVHLWASALPLAGLCDLLENALHLYLLVRGPEYTAQWVLIASLAALIKWSLAVAFGVALLAELSRRLLPAKPV